MIRILPAALALAACLIPVSAATQGTEDPPASRFQIQLEDESPGCFWSERKKKLICIDLPPDDPPVVIGGGGSCGGSSRCGGNSRTQPDKPPDDQSGIFRIDPGSQQRAGNLQFTPANPDAVTQVGSVESMSSQ